VRRKCNERGRSHRWPITLRHGNYSSDEVLIAVRFGFQRESPIALVCFVIGASDDLPQGCDHPTALDTPTGCGPAIER
jgi:hypothetical protein